MANHLAWFNRQLACLFEIASGVLFSFRVWILVVSVAAGAGPQAMNEGAEGGSGSSPEPMPYSGPEVKEKLKRPIKAV